MIGHTIATFSVIVSGDRDSNSTHAACGLVEARNCGDSWFCFRGLKVGAEHSQLRGHGWSRSSERKEQVFGFHGLSRRAEHTFCPIDPRVQYPGGRRDFSRFVI